MAKACIWLTRPAADSERFAQELARHGIPTLVAPVMRIEPAPLRIAVSKKPDALLLTSRHAAPSLASLPADWQRLPLYAVGDATAHAARRMGWQQVVTGPGDVMALLPRIVADLPANARLLYLAGEETRVDIVGLLTPHNITVEMQVVYRATAETQLTEACITALHEQRFTGVAFFSPRSASLAAELLMQHRLTQSVSNLDAYCLSLPVAATAGALPWHALHVCHAPTAETMRELIVTLAKKMIDHSHG